MSDPAVTIMTIFRSALINRRPGLTDGEFREHWIRIHGSLASELPGLRSYRQNHIVRRLYEASDVSLQSIDGISQLAFDDIRAMEASEASAAYSRVKADIPKFQGGITILVLEAEEFIADASDVLPACSSAHKLLWLSTSRDRDASQVLHAKRSALDWLQNLNMPGIRRYVQSLVVDRDHPVHAGVKAGDAGPIETLSELWFESTAALDAAIESTAGRGLIFQNVATRAIAVYVVEEVHIEISRGR